MDNIINADDKNPEEKYEKIRINDIKDETVNNVNNIFERSLDFMALRDQKKSQNKNDNKQ